MSEQAPHDDDAHDPVHAELGALLRGSAPAAPDKVAHRALGRIHVERQALALARALGGSLLRVMAALPDYLPEYRAEFRPRRGGAAPPNAASPDR